MIDAFVAPKILGPRTGARPDRLSWPMCILHGEMRLAGKSTPHMQMRTHRVNCDPLERRGDREPFTPSQPFALMLRLSKI